MVRLEPMTPEDYQAFLVKAIKEYADDHIRDGRWSAAEAMDESAKEYAELLPNGLKTPDHYLYTVVDERDDRPVGMLWYAVRPGPKGPTAFIYDIRMHEDARGQGHGTQTLAALEEEAKARGVTSISLHVFGHNEGAFRLYQRVGYRVTNMMMAKDLE
jgi:ribosomal protein S18 acetylase RimI-like enzyme